MRATILAMCLWGVADGILLAASPRSWFEFWQPKIEAISSSRTASILAAFAQISMCLYVIKLLKKRKRN